MGEIILAILDIILAVITPLFAIWALNTLFSLSIPYTLESWAASMVLCSVIRGNK
jgi:hypothetical protein